MPGTQAIPEHTDTSQPESAGVLYYPGLWKGRVTSINDPQRRGRVRVRVYQLHEDLNDDEVPLMEPLFPYGGSSDLGFFSIPPIGSTVWVAFENEYFANPVWLGTYYHAPDGNSFVPSEALDKYPNNIDKIVVLKDTVGNVFIMDAEEGEIRIATTGGNSITMTDGDGVTIEDSAGSKLELDDAGKATLQNSGGTKVEMDATGQFLISTPSGTTLTIDPAGGVTVMATGQILLQSSLIAQILATLIILGPAGIPAARLGDPVLIPSTAPAGLPSTGFINAGSALVLES